MSEPITFTASFPAIASAIIVSGNGDGLRIKLDIPEVELMNALSLFAMRQTAFKVTIEPLDEQPKQAARDKATAPKRTKAKRRN